MKLQPCAINRLITFVFCFILSCFTLMFGQTFKENEIKAKQYYYRGITAQTASQELEAMSLLSYAYRLTPQDPYIAHSLAGLYMKQGLLYKALPLLLVAYQSDNKNRDFVRDYAISLASSDSTERASEILEHWILSDPTDEEVQQYLAKIYARSGKFQKAIDLYAKLKELNVQVYSEYARLSHLRARLLFATNQKKLAQEEFEDLTRRFPYEPNAKVRAVNFLLDQNMSQEAEKYLVQLSQDSSFSRLELRNLYIPYYKSISDSLSWEGLLVEELADFNVDSKIKMEHWISYLGNKSVGDTLPVQYNWVFDKIIKQHPEDSESALSYAKQLQIQGLSDKSISILYPMTKTAPEQVEVWTLLMGQLVDAKQYGDLLSLSEKGLFYHPNEWRLVYLGSANYLMQQEKEAAIKYIELYLPKLNKSGADDYGLSLLYGILGDLYEDTDRGRAYECYDKALVLNEDNTDVLNNYAYFLSQEERELDKAERMALRGLKLKKDDPNLLDTYAWILFLRGNSSLAALYMRKALDVAKEDEVSAVFYDHYGDILEAQGDVAKAKGQRSKALQLYRTELEDKIKDNAKKKEIRLLKAKIKLLEVIQKKLR